MCSKSPQAGAINGRSSEDHEAHRCVWYHLAQLQTHSIRQKEISPISQFTGWIRIKQTNCRGESNCSSLHCGDGAARFPGLTFIISEFINKATRSGQTQARLKAHSGENACLRSDPRWATAKIQRWSRLCGLRRGRCRREVLHCWPAPCTHGRITCALTTGTGVWGRVFISLVLLIECYLRHWCLALAWEHHNTSMQVCGTASLTHCYAVSNQHGDINQSSLLSGPWGCLIHVSLVEIAFALLLSLPWEECASFTLWPNGKTLL